MKAMLKEIIFVLSDMQYARGWEMLQKQLEKAGISSNLICGKDKNMQFVEECRENNLPNECLIVTDSERVYRCLKEKQNAKVIVMIHEANRRNDFSGAKYAIETLENLEYDYFERVYLRFCALPWNITETRRCFIREMTENDVDELYEIYREPSITEYMEGLYEERAEEISYIKEYIEKVYSFYGFGTWIVIHKDTHKIIGRVGFNWRAGYDEPELGFMIAVPYQRQGYAYEVCQAVLKTGCEEYGFEQVQALVRNGNRISKQLCLKLGFCYKGQVMEEGYEHQRFLWERAK
jgi:[ribosomal protein S5]-alanine N-acetyltransferase